LFTSYLDNDKLSFNGFTNSNRCVLQYRSGSTGLDTRPSEDYVIIGGSRVEDLKNEYDDFDLLNYELELPIEQDPKTQSNSKSILIFQLEESLAHYLEKTRIAVLEDYEVHNFLGEREALLEELEKIIPTLEEHIKKHYPEMEI
jgi:hypothetical protein